MELDLHTFKKIEAVGWTVLSSILFFFFGYVIFFLLLCLGIRTIFMRFKNAQLGMLDTEGKTVLITGCDSGFGLGLAHRLHDKGFTVFASCLNVDSDGGKALVNLAERGRMRVLPLDVGSDDSVDKCLRYVKQQCENTGLWGLVNNAGVIYIGDAELTPMSAYLELANINLFGMVRTCRAFLPLLRQAKGRVVNVTSVKGLCVIPSNAAYTITKYGAEAFSETLRLEMTQFGVHVSVIEPGHFGGTTGCLNASGIKRIKSLLEEQWQEASAEAKEFYGQAHLLQEFEDVKNLAGTTATSIQPVLDAFEDALRSRCPRVRYLVDGSNSYIDVYTLLARLSPFLPLRFLDKLRAYFFPYSVYK